jgi:hypothetical protein
VLSNQNRAAKTVTASCRFVGGKFVVFRLFFFLPRATYIVDSQKKTAASQSLAASHHHDHDAAGNFKSHAALFEEME